jgi:hypothetical protein
LALAKDEDAVEAVGPEHAYPAFGVGVGVWRSDRRADDRHAFAAEDLVEAAARLLAQEPPPTGAASFR